MGLFKKIFKKKQKEITVDQFIQNQVKVTGGLYNAIDKEMLEHMMKQYPESEHPIIVNSNGKLSFTNKDGKTIKLEVPLLTIVPIPRIPKDSIDLDKYYKENFGEYNSKKDIKDIESVKLNIPNIAICPVPAISDMEKIEN